MSRRVLGDRVDEVAARVTVGGVGGWYLTDRQGSVRAVLGPTGAVVGTVSYDGFGTRTGSTGSADRYGYTGREWVDAAGGLWFLRDRLLSTDTGSFLTPDRMGFGAGDANLTRYVRNQFPNATDPSGKVDPAGPGSLVAATSSFAPAIALTGEGGVGGSGGTGAWGTIPTGGGADLAPVEAGGEISLWDWPDIWWDLKGIVARAVDVALDGIGAVFWHGWSAAENIAGSAFNGLKKGINAFGTKLLNNPAGYVLNWVFGGTGQAVPDVNNVGQMFDYMADQMGLSWDSVLNRVLQKADDKFGLTRAVRLYEALPQSVDGVIAAADGFAGKNLVDLGVGALVSGAKSMLIDKLTDPGFWVQRFTPWSLPFSAAKAFLQVIGNPKTYELVNNVLDGVQAAIDGWEGDVSDRVAPHVERGLEAAFNLTLDVASSVIGLSKPKESLRKAVRDVAGRAQDAIDKLMDKLLGKIPNVPFGHPGHIPLGPTDDFQDAKGATHHTWVEAQGGDLALMVGSTPMKVFGKADGLSKDKGLKPLFDAADAMKKASDLPKTDKTRSKQVLDAGKVLLKELNSPLVERYARDCLARGGTACFAAGTKLWTPQGYRAIEEIRAGERVFSRDQWDEQGEVSAKIVEEVFERYAGVYDLLVTGGRTIRTTGEHPFFVSGKGWTAANELRAGDRLAGADGPTVAVESVTDTGEWVPVYNLRVSDHHTYFVGNEEWGFSVWAHNAYMFERDQRYTQEGERYVRLALQIFNNPHLLPRNVKFKTTVAYSESVAKPDHALIYLYISPDAGLSSGDASDIQRNIQTVFSSSTVSVQAGGYGHAERRLYDNHRGEIHAIGISNPLGPCGGLLEPGILAQRGTCWRYFQDALWENIWFPPVP